MYLFNMFVPFCRENLRHRPIHTNWLIFFKKSQFYCSLKLVSLSFLRFYLFIPPSLSKSRTQISLLSLSLKTQIITLLLWLLHLIGQALALAFIFFLWNSSMASYFSIISFKKSFSLFRIKSGNWSLSTSIVHLR